MPKNMLTEQTDKFFFSNRIAIYQAARALVDDDEYGPMRALLAGRFESGARWAHEEEAKLSPHIARFLEMCVLLGPRTLVTIFCIGLTAIFGRHDFA